jgi:hypothetical protein
MAGTSRDSQCPEGSTLGAESRPSTFSFCPAQLPGGWGNWNSLAQNPLPSSYLTLPYTQGGQWLKGITGGWGGEVQRRRSYCWKAVTLPEEVQENGILVCFFLPLSYAVCHWTIPPPLCACKYYLY